MSRKVIQEQQKLEEETYLNNQKTVVGRIINWYNTDDSEQPAPAQAESSSSTLEKDESRNDTQSTLDKIFSWFSQT